MEKTKVIRINAKNIIPIVLQDGELEEFDEFTYLGICPLLRRWIVENNRSLRQQDPIIYK